MTYSHLQADCLYTGISSGPNARYRVWEAFFFTFYLSTEIGLSVPLSPTIGLLLCHNKRLSAVKAKFHYASWFGAGSEQAPNKLRTGSEPAANQLA